MFDGLFAFGHSIASFMTLESIFFALASCLVGVIIGALPGLTATMGVALLVFFAIALQCVSTLAILAKESGSSSLAVKMFAGYFLFAYLAAVAVYQLASLFT